MKNNIHITPVFQNEPDIEKLGRAIIAVANRIADKKTVEGIPTDSDETGDELL